MKHAAAAAPNRSIPGDEAVEHRERVAQGIGQARCKDADEGEARHREGRSDDAPARDVALDEPASQHVAEAVDEHQHRAVTVGHIGQNIEYLLYLLVFTDNVLERVAFLYFLF